MTTGQADSAERERRWHEVLAACIEHPEFVGELAEFFAGRDRLARLAAPLRSLLQGGRRESPPREAPTVAAGEGVVLTPPPDGAPRSFGDFDLVEEVGRGGMGVVYKARQKSLNRVVALKMILAGQLAALNEVQRFRTEAEAAAHLDHPNIVPVYQVGEHQGRHYFSMKLVEGGSLAEKLGGKPLPVREAARLVAALARAVHHAHERRVVHRDLKPANILFGADGTPQITDFGLAKHLGEDRGQTAGGQLLGTPGYMAPEQACGRAREAGPVTDIYGLGAILYECLTGRPPFQAASVLETLELVRGADPVPPRLLNPRLDPDVQTVCLKCLEKEPERRYPSALALAEDLDRYLNGDAVRARSYNVLARLTRALGKNSHQDAQFRAWGSLLLLFGGITLVGHLVTFALIQTGQPRWIDMLWRAAQLLLGLLALWHSRGRRLLPAGAAERQLWAVWVGYLAAYGAGSVVCRLLIAGGVLVGGPAAPGAWKELLTYPFSAVLSGLAFFVMGGSYWARYYAVGLAFFALAALMPLHLDWAPLAFGLLWTACLVGIGLHLRRLGAGR